MIVYQASDGEFNSAPEEKERLVAATMIMAVKLNDLDPQAWIDVLARFAITPTR